MGNPSIFYGDEVGIQGLGNLANRKTFPWGSEDKELLEYIRVGIDDLFVESLLLNSSST